MQEKPIWQNRAIWAALGTIIATIAISYTPDLGAYQDYIVAFTVTVGALLSGAYTFREFANEAASLLVEFVEDTPTQEDDKILEALEGLLPVLAERVAPELVKILGLKDDPS